MWENRPGSLVIRKGTKGVAFLCLMASVAGLLVALVSLGHTTILPHKPAVSPARQTTIRPPPVAGPQLMQTYGRFPLYFEANQGQTDPQVKFLARGRGYRLFLTPTEALLVLRQTSSLAEATAHPAHSELSHQAASNTQASNTDSMKPTVLRLRFVGANAQPEISGQSALFSKVHYLIGNDASQWRTNLPTYRQVWYRHLYPGIDLVYYGKPGQLEYDLVVAPGADPAVITLGFQGVQQLTIDAQGDLLLHTRAGMMHHRKPLMYQEVDGVRRFIAGHYVLKDTQHIGFQVAAYDSNYPLIIDPILFYATYAGGIDADQALGATANAAGQLGNGSVAPSSTPVSVSNLSNAVAVAAQTTHSLAVRSDGVVVAWVIMSTSRRVSNLTPSAARS